MFSMREVLAYGWRATWAQPWQVHMGWLLLTAANEVCYFGLDQLPEDAYGATTLGVIASYLFSMLGWYPFVLYALDRHRGGARPWRELVSGGPNALAYIQLSVLAAALLVPAMLLVIPCLWLIAAYGPAIWVALDQGTSFGETLTRTAALTRGARYSMLWLSLVLGVPSLIGMGLEVALGPLGYFLQVPCQMFGAAWTTHAYTHVYACLKARNRLPELA